jgi:hypothetical protein
MKTRLFLITVLLAIVSVCFGQQNSAWTKWSWLVGDWKGEGNGQPGQGGGVFTFKTDLDSKILIRKAHSEYPATGNKPAVVHDDLMIVYPDFSGAPSKAIYFDNEGHTINYSITYRDKSIVLVSDKIPNIPVFRLTYTQLSDKSVNVKFEMSQDGEKFMTYVDGTCVKE